ncbi:MAG TPA: histidine--tRNA ligase [Acholeplasma sp.]|nr:histidine--tRNA ligase [Acholeplasma sp.]
MLMNRAKGTYDVLPNDIKKWQYLENIAKNIATKYNFSEIRTPIFEYSGVFHRESELSDMVTKETYNFKDKGNRDLTLRPEGTAGVIRAYVENKLYVESDLLKVYSIGPNFRYERPQKGRYRQFSQFSLEAIGIKSALLDAEVIKMSQEFIETLGLKNVSIEINSIGDLKSRENYLEALVNYLTPFKEELSNDSKERLIKNPLRILDSKDKKDQEIIKDAPKPIDYLSVESSNYFNELLKYLKIFNVNYKVNNQLVRGLDYYSDTVFEVKAEIKDFGAQNVLGGGGRYDNLVSELGGPKTSAIGFAFGMERLLYALEAEEVLNLEEDSLDVFIINFSKEFNLYTTSLLTELRNNNYFVDLDFTNKSFKSQLKKALKLNAKILVIVGDEEFNNNMVTVKNTKTEEQTTIKKDELIKTIKKELGY